jgi:hypothetical protein
MHDVACNSGVSGKAHHRGNLGHCILHDEGYNECVHRNLGPCIYSCFHVLPCCASLQLLRQSSSEALKDEAFSLCASQLASG